MDPVLITGLFSETFQNENKIPEKIVSEMRTSLLINKWYREKLIFLAGDGYAARLLKNLGLKVYAIFDDAPEWVLEKPAFRMKHWMVYQMLCKYPEVIWIDWDTISIKPLDRKFFRLCRQCAVPKFLYIPLYHSVINCSVYYVSQNWLEKMKKTLDAAFFEVNDERMWLSVLPKDIQE